MNEGNAAMTYNAFMDTRAIKGVPGVAVRLGRALENWGRRAAQPIDREQLRRERERMLANEARMLRNERLARQHR
jgi:hypothetical protein